MRKRYKYKGTFKADASFWGQHLTADHVVSVKERMQAVTGDNHAFVIQDIFSKLKNLYPVSKKDAVETETSIRDFVGDRGVRRLYSDNPGEISKALK